MKIDKLIFKLILTDKFNCSLRFKKAFGKWVNWKHPTTFNEKMQVKKIYDRKQIYTDCVDRFKVRKYISDKIGEEHLIPLLFYGNPNELLNTTLKTPFIIKTTHNIGTHLIIKDKDCYNIEKTIIDFNKRMKENYYPLYIEYQYKNVEPKIVVEKLMLENNNLPTDYKFHCFNGKVKFVQIINGRNKNKTKESNYDSNWNMQEFILTYPKHETPVKQPDNLKEMITIAEKLSEDFDYVRVDLYNINNKIYFGELTFTPESGFLKIKPKEWDLKIGEYWK